MKPCTFHSPATRAINEVVAGRIDFYFSPIAPALALIRDGKLQPLAVASSRRAIVPPDVPTTVEAGLPDSGYDFWIGAFAPGKTPRAIVERLGEELSKALETPTVRARFSSLGADPMPMRPGEFDEFIQKEVELNASIVKAAGITPQ